jgi:hypothetical protein
MSFETFSAVGCTHGDLINQVAKKAFLSWVKDFKPKHRFHLGDAFDFRSLRRGADPKEEGDSLEDDWAEGNKFLDEYRPTVLTLGNHDGGRLWRAAFDWRGITRAYAEMGIKDLQNRCKKNKTILVPYNSRTGIYKFGDTAMLHGYHAGVNATRLHAQTYRKCLFAHLHRVEEASVPGLDDATAQCIGSLANFEAMDYASQRTATLAWRAGWAHGVINTKTGKVTWWMCKQQDDGTFLCPSGTKQY